MIILLTIENNQSGAILVKTISSKRIKCIQTPIQPRTQGLSNFAAGGPKQKLSEITLACEVDSNTI